MEGDSAITAFILAHAGSGEHGLLAGFLHPITGLDHLLAAVAVGVLAQQLGKHAAVILPIAFVSGMLVGGGLARTGVALPGVELGIVASLLAVGLAVALRRAGSIWACATAAGVLAIFHGHAHLAEYETTTGLAGYVTGLLVATGLLHATGVGAASALAQMNQPKLEPVRVIGGIVFVFGAFKLAGIV